MIDMDNVRKNFKYFSLFALTLGLSLSSLGHAQNFYKWVDANGSVHYSDTAPTNKKVKVEKIGTYNDTPSGSSYQPPAQNPAEQQAQPENKETAPAPAQPSESTAPAVAPEQVAPTAKT